MSKRLTGHDKQWIADKLQNLPLYDRVKLLRLAVLAAFKDEDHDYLAAIVAVEAERRTIRNEGSSTASVLKDLGLKIVLDGGS